MEGLNEITSQTSYLETLSLVLMIISIAFFIAAVVIWFVFKIPHSIKVLMRINSGKNMDKVQYNANSNVHASLSWNTSARLDRKPEYVSMNMNVDSDETQLLTDETVVLDQETTVLNLDELGFEIEEDIIMTGAENDLK